MTDDPKFAADRAISAARRAGRVRREEQDRVAELIEQALYEAKEQETVDALVMLAQNVLDPVRK